jgi:hypothetical protein
MKNLNKKLSAVVLTASFVFGGTVPMVAFAAGPEAINLGSAGSFAVLAKSGISTTGTTLVVGDIGVSPVAATFITGFGLILPSASAFSTSALVTGKVYASDYAVPTPSNMTTAISNMETAYTDGAGRTNPTATELGAGNIGGMTLAPGLYKWGTGLIIPSDVTLSGGANDVWIFQIAQNLNISSNVKVILSGGAQAGNIFWVVAGQTTIGTGAVFNGNILDQTAIVLNTGATLNGRALAQTAVTLDANSVNIPSVSIPAVPATPAIPAVTTVSPTVSATPAIPATPAVPVTTAYTTQSSTGETDLGCFSGNKFSVTTGRNCSSVSVTTTNDSGCLSGNKFSITTGNVCTPGVSSSSFGQEIRTIAVNLMEGSRGSNVSTLQQFLISQNKGSAAAALSLVGATSYFGTLTRAALAEFQANVGISPALGNFGTITRGYVSAHY